jgi:hypothetical protein
MKTFRNFLEEAALTEMRKEDQVKGKKKTPLYINPEKDVIKKSPEGRWKKTAVKQFAGKGVINPEVSQARMKRPSTGASVGHSGYMSSPQDPGAPQPHGTSGGKAGSLRGVRQRGKPKDDPIGDPSTPRTKFLHQTPAEKVKRRKEKARFSGGYDYKTGRIG